MAARHDWLGNRERWNVESVPADTQRRLVEMVNLVGLRETSKETGMHWRTLHYWLYRWGYRRMYVLAPELSLRRVSGGEE